MTEGSWTQFADTILVFAGNRPLEVDLRRPISAATAAQLRGLGLGDTYAVITPCNPMGRYLPDVENAGRVELLRQQLVNADVRFLPADGWAADRSHVEPGFACGLPLHAAQALAREWEQLALFWFDGGTMHLLAAELDRRCGDVPAD